MGNWYLGNYKKEGEKYLRVLTEDAKVETLGPSEPPCARKGALDKNYTIILTSVYISGLRFP